MCDGEPPRGGPSMAPDGSPQDELERLAARQEALLADLNRLTAGVDQLETQRILSKTPRLSSGQVASGFNYDPFADTVQSSSRRSSMPVQEAEVTITSRLPEAHPAPKVSMDTPMTPESALLDLAVAQVLPPTAPPTAAELGAVAFSDDGAQLPGVRIPQQRLPAAPAEEEAAEEKREDASGDGSALPRSKKESTSLAPPISFCSADASSSASREPSTDGLLTSARSSRKPSLSIAVPETVNERDLAKSVRKMGLSDSSEPLSPARPRPKPGGPSLSPPRRATHMRSKSQPNTAKPKLRLRLPPGSPPASGGGPPSHKRSLTDPGERKASLSMLEFTPHTHRTSLDHLALRTDRNCVQLLDSIRGRSPTQSGPEEIFYSDNAMVLDYTTVPPRCEETSFVITSRGIMQFPVLMAVAPDPSESSVSRDEDSTKSYLIANNYKRIVFDGILAISLPYDETESFAVRTDEFAIHLRTGSTLWVRVGKTGERSECVEVISQSYELRMGEPLILDYISFGELRRRVVGTSTEGSLWSHMRASALLAWSKADVLKSGRLLYCAAKCKGKKKTVVMKAKHFKSRWVSLFIHHIAIFGSAAETEAYKFCESKAAQGRSGNQFRVPEDCLIDLFGAEVYAVTKNPTCREFAVFVDKKREFYWRQKPLVHVFRCETPEEAKAWRAAIALRRELSVQAQAAQQKKDGGEMRRDLEARTLANGQLRPYYR